MKKIELSLVIGIIACIILSSFTAFAKECDVIRQSSLRLHIMANSDDASDQKLKLAVRDAILAQAGDLFIPAQDKAQASEIAQQNLATIEQIAADQISASGYDYTATASCVNMFFTTRQYENVTLPAGNYDAIRVEIGTGKGKNWWCVMFPPMCVPAASEKSKIPLQEQIEQLGNGETMRYKPKFAVVELVETIKNKLNEKSTPLG